VSIWNKRINKTPLPLEEREGKEEKKNKNNSN